MRLTEFKGYNLKEVHVRWTGIFIVAYIMTFIHPIEPHETVLYHYFTSFTFTSIYWNGAVMLFLYLRKKFPEIRKTPKRLFITFISVVIFLIVCDPLICYVFNFKPIEVALLFDNLLHNLLLNVIAVLIVGSIYENVYFFEQWKKSIQLNEALKNQQIRTQFEVLQNQMSPHFLFNSLNTLTTLIAEDGKVAIEFTEKLSEVYRYILQNKEKEVVRLRDELEFANNYIFLLKIRFPKNLNASFNVDKKYFDLSIAPLTIQMLVENAIKHNRISKGYPLNIEIYVDHNNSVVVKNNLQKKNVIEKSTKTGLENIKKRYAYFGKNNIDVFTDSSVFHVTVPLLNVRNDKDQLITV